MKLLIYIYSLQAGGAERVTVNIANALVENRWQVTIVTLADASEDFYEVAPGVKRVSLSMTMRSGGIFSALDHNFKRLRALRRLIASEMPDVALSMMSTANCLLGLAAMGSGVPVIGSERIHPPMIPLGRPWEFLRRKVYPRLAAIVAQTDQSRQWLRIHTGAERIEVIPNPVIYPLNSHEPKLLPSDFPSLHGRKFILGVGRLAHQKGFDCLIESFARLAPEFQDWNLVILGEGRERERLENLVISHGQSSRILMPGRVGNMGDWYRAADLFVMSSRFEGFPNSLLEALAYGLPCISVDCQTGPAEILRHKENGLLVPSGKNEALTDALRTMIESESDRQLYASRSIEVRERFSAAQIISRWESLFLRVCRS